MDSHQTTKMINPPVGSLTLYPSLSLRHATAVNCVSQARRVRDVTPTLDKRCRNRQRRKEGKSRISGSKTIRSTAKVTIPHSLCIHTYTLMGWARSSPRIRRATSGLTLRGSVLAKQRAIYVNNARNRAPARGQNGIAGSEFPEVFKRKVNERGSKNRPE